MVAPILMLHRQRDARYERPCALCERLRTLCERGCVLAPPSPCAGGAGLASARGLADGCSEAELLLCATGSAGESKRIGPGRQSEPLRLGTVTADCPTGAALFAAQRAARARCACGLAALHPRPRLPGPESSFSVTAAGSVLASMAVAGLSLGAWGGAG
jgi:hypothetical protein